jgi:hypothetical protein
MRFLSRMFYAFTMTAIVVGVLMVLDMIVSFGAGQFMFSEFFVVPCFVLAYLAAPYIARRIKLD